MTDEPSDDHYNRTIFAVIKVNCTIMALQKNLVQEILGLGLGYLQAFTKHIFIFLTAYEGFRTMDTPLPKTDKPMYHSLCRFDGFKLNYINKFKNLTICSWIFIPL